MIKYDVARLAQKLAPVMGRDVNRCVRARGRTRPAFYFVDKSYSPALYVVLYTDRPGEVEELGKQAFDSMFATSAPNKKIQDLLDAMPNFRDWRDWLGKG